MYEDHTIEKKYLHNFSPKEKLAFYREQKQKVADLAKYEGKLYALMFSDSSAIFGNDPQSSSALEIKYVLNRIAANDPRDTAFELNQEDSVSYPDNLALRLASAIQNNTHCKSIVLKGIGLTDKGALPLLTALKTKELSSLCLAQNSLSEKSFQTIDTILSDSQNKWRQINLGHIKLPQQLANSLKRHTNLSFIPMFQISSKRKELFGFLKRKKEHLK